MVTIRLRRDTVANWLLANPVLQSGETGVEIDTDKFKIGDGLTSWISLAYASNNDAVVAEAVARSAADTSLLGNIDAVSAAIFAAIPFDPNETITSGDIRVYRGGRWQATQNLPPGIPPLGVGDGSVADQNLLLEHRGGYANWVTGGAGGTVFTVHNQNDTGAGSLRQTILDAQVVCAAGGKAWIVFDKTFNGGVYNIVCTSDFLQIAGPGAWDMTIDGRGCDVTIDAAGAPGKPPALGGTGVPGNTFVIGGWVYSDFNRAGNTTPAHNIIIHGIKFISNFGGENEITGQTFHRVVMMQWWPRGIWWDHCEFTNPDPNTDGCFEGDWSTTEVTMSWCWMHAHFKAWIVIDSAPPLSSGAAGPLAPGISVGSPGPYEIWVNPSNSADQRTVCKFSAHHCHFQHISDRGPYVKGDASRWHGWNIFHDTWGVYTPDNNVTEEQWPDFVNNGHSPNIGAATRMGHNGQVVEENSVFTPYADGLPGGMFAFHTKDPVNGNLRTSGNLLEPFTRGPAQRDPDRGTCFTPPYPYSPDPADTTLKSKIATGAGATVSLWTYLGPGTISTTISTYDEGSLSGAAKKLNFVGTGISSAFDGIDKTTVTVTAAAADPTTILLVGTSLPTPDATYSAKRFRVVPTLDAPTNGTEYECRHNTGLNVWEWQQVAGPVIPAIGPGDEIFHFAYNPATAPTNAQTTSTTLVDITTAAIAASWVGVSAASFDATFTVPPSRVVIVELEVCWQILAGKKAWLALANAGTTITLTQQLMSNTTAILRQVYRKRLDSTVLPAVGASYTVRPQWCTETSGTPTLYVGQTNGSFRVRVLASL